MDASYKRDFHHSYLILRDSKIPDCESYSVRMMLNSSIPGLLPCEIHKIDNQALFYYEITSKQSLASLYEIKKLNRENLVLLMGALMRTMETMEAYLLNPAYLILHPEYIYMSAADGEIGFCCWPCESEKSMDFLQFTEYLLPRIDHQDREAVVMGYHLYRRAMEGQFCPEEIREELYREPIRPVKVQHEDEVREMASDIALEKMEQEHQRRQEVLDTLLQEACEDEGMNGTAKTGLCIAGAGFLVVLSVYLVRNQYFSWPVFAAVAGGLIVILGLGILASRAIRKGNDRKRELPSENHLENALSDMIENSVDSLPDIMEEAETSLLYTEPAKACGILKAVHPVDMDDICLRKGTIVLGKMSGAVDVVLPSPSVSRVHAKVRWDDDCMVFDLNSKNGTYINQTDVVGCEGKKLREGDTVTFADLVYRYMVSGQGELCSTSGCK